MSKSVFETFLGSYGHFFDETTPKDGKNWEISVNLPPLMTSKNRRRFTKKVAVAAEKRLRNTFRHRERVQGILIDPQMTWFDLKIITFAYFLAES